MRPVRPTSAKVLQALFNILGPIQGMAFLDLFAGTGRVACEAWRRGARPVYAVELLRGRCEDLRPLGKQDELHVWFLDVRKALGRLQARQIRFDVVFLDPPYGAQWVTLLIPLLASHRPLFHERTRIVLERSLRESLPEDLSGLALQEERHYGETVLTFLGPSFSA
ncbi:MAG: RsmD family RNA methyltransferase [Synergistaceae bacterium]|nr:RsmD family RNA methyltransferase [Synergistaceae bacterium]